MVQILSFFDTTTCLKSNKTWKWTNKKKTLLSSGCFLLRLFMTNDSSRCESGRDGPGWRSCHKDAAEENRHDFMANDSCTNISVGCRGDNQVELS